MSIAGIERPLDVGHPAEVSRTSRLLVAAAPALVALAFVALYVGAALLLATPAVAPGTDGYGYVGDTWLHGLMRWDGAWYAAIARGGYHALSGRFEPYAYFPLFPAVVATLHTLLPMLTIPSAGLVINAAAVVAAAVLLHASLPEWPSWHRLLAVAAVLAVPSMFFSVAFYSEGLFLLATALVVWSTARPSRLWWAPVGVAVGTLDRPVGALLLILLAATLMRDPRPRAQRVAIAAVACVGAAAVPLVYWLAAGDPIAFATAQAGWTSLRTLGLQNALRWVAVQVNPFTATDPVVGFGYWELLVIALPLLLWIRHRFPAVAVFAGVTIAASFVLGGVGTQSRYLAALTPLWLYAIVVLQRRSPRAWVPVTATAICAGLACNVWLIGRFASGVWAG